MEPPYVAALTAVALAAWTGPAHAAPVLAGTTCGMVTLLDPVLEWAYEPYTGAMAMPQPAGLGAGGDPVAGEVTCEVRVNGVLKDVQTTEWNGPLGDVAYLATPWDVVTVCTIWRLGDATYHWDASSESFVADAASATCPRAAAPLDWLHVVPAVPATVGP